MVGYHLYHLVHLVECECAYLSLLTSSQMLGLRCKW